MPHRHAHATQSRWRRRYSRLTWPLAPLAALARPLLSRVRLATPVCSFQATGGFAVAPRLLKQASGSLATYITCLGRFREGWRAHARSIRGPMQVCVDWCDAHAYCKPVGKRLCGKIGGGPNLYADYASASSSEWYRACSSGGSFTYPIPPQKFRQRPQKLAELPLPPARPSPTARPLELLAGYAWCR
jgi:hypothetical protein